MDCIRSAIEAYLHGEASAAIAVALLLLSTRDTNRAAEAIDAVERETVDAGMRSRLAELKALFDEHRKAYATIVQMLDVIESTGAVELGIADTNTRIARCAGMFDTLVQQSEESSVALYSLGSVELLDKATDEVVNRMRALNLVASNRVVLQIGCGIGRMEEKLAPSVAEAHGLDISPKMIEACRRRCRHLTNVQFRVGSGRDLQPYEAGHFDLVYAIDSMPYVVEIGDAVVSDYFAEARRVLKPCGMLLIDNYSYRNDPLRDDRDVLTFADEAGFDVVLCGAQPFSFWNGREYLLRLRT